MPSLLLNWRLLLLFTFFIAPFCVGYAIELVNNDEASYTNESDLNEFSKKWFRINLDSSSNGLWENKEVKYYIKGLSQKDGNSLETQINEAMELWYCAGLDDSFKVKRVHTLTRPRNRSKYLVVQKVDSGASSSTNGCPVNGKPVSTLSLDPNSGTQNVVSNIAHEIGHWFGLLHEHQNPAFREELSPFFEFRCQNLADYDAKTQGLDAADITILCDSYQQAGDAGFSAAEFAPIRGGGAKGPVFTHEEQDDGAKVDWDSIMLYPSKAGGRGVGDNRENVLMRLDKNGENPQEIPPNLEPSDNDVEGLHQLYGAV